MHRFDHIQLSTHNGQILPHRHILTVKPLLDLTGNTFFKYRRKEIVYFLKLLTRNVPVVLLLQDLESVGQHIVDVLNKNAFIDGHINHLIPDREPLSIHRPSYHHQTNILLSAE